MRTIPAREIKRRGIAAVDDALKNGPVHVIKNDRPSYVVMDEECYQEILATMEEAEVARVRASLSDLDVGQARRVSAQGLIDEYGLED
jgi:PHD/YefM family antitoxin component YafN of YafNO toxin-antitoxin module